jgi:hypothetical protein
MREPHLPKPFGFSHPPCHTPRATENPLEKFPKCIWRWNSHCAFWAFGCGLLFGLQSFLFSSLVPFVRCFFFIYLFIHFTLHSEMQRKFSFADQHSHLFYVFREAILPPSCHSHCLQLKGTPIFCSPHTLKAPSRKHHLTSSK